jgi:hypothetical protein
MGVDGVGDRRVRIPLGRERVEQTLELAGGRLGQAEAPAELLERFP